MTPPPATESPRPSLLPLIGTLVLAAGLWFVTFVVDWGSFWVKISLSAASLAVLSLVIQRRDLPRFQMDGKATLLGLGSAAALYGVFYLGKLISTLIFPFAEGQIGGIYELGEGSEIWLISLLLLFVTGPAEEIYWRGYVQRSLERRLGGFWGYVVAVAVYAGVHACTLNFILVGAAGVAGAFWGLIYWRVRNLAPVIISHSVWSAVIFSVLPIE